MSLRQFNIQNRSDFPSSFFVFLLHDDNELIRSMITKAYIQEYGNRKMESEHKDVWQTLESRNICCHLFTNKKILRNQLVLDKETFVAGDHFVFSSIFRKYNIKTPNDCYPKSLKKYLKRNIYSSTIKELFKNFNGNSPYIFVKPKTNTKLFTGFVLESDVDFFRLLDLPGKTELYCSEVVNWVSEYRVFVNNGKVVGIKIYSGMGNNNLDLNFIQSVISNFEESSEKTKAYALDFGVLSNGETALVEWNDGFALGSYNLNSDIYTDFLLERWKEILSSIEW